jgi:hypothetical protein
VYQKAGRQAEFRKSLERARQAGLNGEMIDPTERVAFEALQNR